MTNGRWIISPPVLPARESSYPARWPTRPPSANGSCLRPSSPRPPASGADRLRQFADTLERIHFSAPPELRLDVRGDARDLGSFGVRVLLSTPGADTPWGTVNQGRFSARLFPATTNGLSSAELSLEAGEAQTRWATNGELAAHRSPGLLREPDEPGERRPDSARRARRDRMGPAPPTCSSPCAEPQSRGRRTSSAPTWRFGRDASRPNGAAPPTPSSMPNGSTP